MVRLVAAGGPSAPPAASRRPHSWHTDHDPRNGKVIAGICAAIATGLQLLSVRQPARRFNGQRKPVGKTTAPPGERRIARPAVETGVQLHCVETRRVVVQPLHRRRTVRVADAVPVVITPPGGADADFAHLRHTTDRQFTAANDAPPG